MFGLTHPLAHQTQLTPSHPEEAQAFAKRRPVNEGSLYSRGGTKVPRARSVPSYPLRLQLGAQQTQL